MQNFPTNSLLQLLRLADRSSRADGGSTRASSRRLSSALIKPKSISSIASSRNGRAASRPGQEPMYRSAAPAVAWWGSPRQPLRVQGSIRPHSPRCLRARGGQRQICQVNHNHASADTSQECRCIQNLVRPRSGPGTHYRATTLPRRRLRGLARYASTMAASVAEQEPPTSSARIRDPSYNDVARAALGGPSAPGTAVLLDLPVDARRSSAAGHH